MDKELAERILNKVSMELPTRKQWGKVFKIMRELAAEEKRIEEERPKYQKEKINNR